jgi:hypothetical protein
MSNAATPSQAARPLRSSRWLYGRISLLPNELLDKFPASGPGHSVFCGDPEARQVAVRHGDARLSLLSTFRGMDQANEYPCIR